MKESIQDEIRRIIQDNSSSMLYTASDFITLGSYSAVRQALVRMEHVQELRRVYQGYYKPYEYHDFLKEEVALDPEVFARKYAESHQWEIVPIEDTALRALGLSHQVTHTHVYGSDGPNRCVKLYDGRKIVFKHRLKREISGKSPLSSLIIESIKAFGCSLITKDIRLTFCGKLNQRTMTELEIQSRSCRRWVYQEVLRIQELFGTCTGSPERTENQEEHYS